MIVDALIKANDVIKIPGKDGKPKKISECVDDMEAYTKLTDNVLDHIMLSTDTKLDESQRIIKNIMCRKLYKCVGQSQPSTGLLLCPDNLKTEIMECMSDDEKESETELKKDDIEVQLIDIDYGKKTNNPVEKVRFYNKLDPNTAFELPKDEVSRMLPGSFSEQTVLLYCKDPTQTVKYGIAARCFIIWCKDNCMKELEI